MQGLGCVWLARQLRFIVKVASRISSADADRRSALGAGGEGRLEAGHSGLVGLLDANEELFPADVKRQAIAPQATIFDQT
jgi:hypothetical protein